MGKRCGKCNRERSTRIVKGVKICWPCYKESCDLWGRHATEAGTRLVRGVRHWVWY